MCDSVLQRPTTGSDSAHERDTEHASACPLAHRDDGAIEAILGSVRGASGLDLSGYRREPLEQRIRRRAQRLSMRSIPAYAAFAGAHPEECLWLRHDLLFGLTSFFRDPDVYEALRAKLLPALLRVMRPGVPLRVWVPACATGEEAYSLAICLLEGLAEQRSARELEIVATDADPASIERARRGCYSSAIRANVSAQRLVDAFETDGSGYRVRDSVRQRVRFVAHDAMTPPPVVHIDLVSCRNLLIYMEPPLQRSVLHNFHVSLQPHGFLLLGSCETVGNSPDLFSLIDGAHRMYAVKGQEHPLLA